MNAIITPRTDGETKVPRVLQLTRSQSPKARVRGSAPQWGPSCTPAVREGGAKPWCGPRLVTPTAHHRSSPAPSVHTSSAHTCLHGPLPAAWHSGPPGPSSPATRLLISSPSKTQLGLLPPLVPDPSRPTPLPTACPYPTQVVPGGLVRFSRPGLFQGLAPISFLASKGMAGAL